MEGTQETSQGCRSPSRDGAAPAGLQPGFQQLCYKAERCSQGASQEPSVSVALTTVPGRSLPPGTPWAATRLGRSVRHGQKGFAPESSSPRSTDDVPKHSPCCANQGLYGSVVGSELRPLVLSTRTAELQPSRAQHSCPCRPYFGQDTCRARGGQPSRAEQHKQSATGFS